MNFLFHRFDSISNVFTTQYLQLLDENGTSVVKF